MKKFSRRLLTFVLACAMVFGLSGMTAFATEAGEKDAQVAAAEPDAISEAEGTVEDVTAEDAAAEETVAEDETVTLDTTEEDKLKYGWYKNGTSPYVISTAEELAGLSDIVNGTAPEDVGQDSFRGKTVELKANGDCIEMNKDAAVSRSCVYPDSTSYNGVADIQVKATEDACVFTPIGNMRFDANGNKTSGYAFEGTFEGNGVTIKNLYVTGDEGYLGLFGVVGTENAAKEGCYGTVRNFTLSGAVECTGGNTNTQMDFVGGAVGKLNAGGTVEYVINEDLFVDAPYTDNVGGIVGFAGTPTAMGYDDNPSVSNTQVLCCENNAPVRAYYKVGGIVGENAATVKYCCNKDKGWILCRRSSGQGAGVGGIVGRNGNNNNADEEALVAFCYNTGIVTNNGRNDNSASNTIRGFAGVCGTTYGSTGKVETHNCYNIGAIPEGYGQYNSITNYIEGGAVAAVRDNYSLDDEELIHQAGDSVQENGYPVSEDKFKVTSRNSGDILYNLGAYFVADTTGEINGGYPILFWEAEEKDEPTVKKLTIAVQPNKTTYNDEVFDPTGMVVTATYSNDAKMVIQPAYAIDGTNTYTLSDCYTYDYTQVLTADNDHIDITFGGITEPVYINDGEKKGYIPVSTSAGDEYQLSYSDINEAIAEADETTIYDNRKRSYTEKFVLLEDLLQKYLDINANACEKLTIDTTEGDLTVPNDEYKSLDNVYLYYDEDDYRLAGDGVNVNNWYKGISKIEVTLHDWSDPEWSWINDYAKTKATRICQNTDCGKVEAVYATINDGTITKTTLAPGKRTVGKTSYTAVAIFPDGTVVTDTQNTDFVAATGSISVVYKNASGNTSGELKYSAINELMDETPERTFTYTSYNEEQEVTKHFVSIADLLDITDTIDDVCCYHVISDVDGYYEIDLPTSACMYYRDDTLIYRTAVDGSAGRMWVDSPTCIEVRYQHDWGDLEWKWTSDYDSAKVMGRCQSDVCEHEEVVTTTEITSGTKGGHKTLTATAVFSDGTVVTDTVIL